LKSIEIDVRVIVGDLFGHAPVAARSPSRFARAASTAAR
jgi:hypothetical protein